jgi:prepilin-type N-terminal cleavage/methylation domain-containing protein
MRRRAFTLIELLVVITIISVLAAVSMPVISKMMEAARFTKCRHNMQQIGVATLTATQDNDNTVIGWYNYNKGRYWWEILLPYLGGAGGKSTVLQCPSDTHFDSNNIAQTVSYGWNYLVVGRSDTDSPPMQLLPLPNFGKPSSTLVMTDSAEPESWGYIDPYGHHSDPLRHHGKTGALFLDGHIETLDISAVTTAEPYLDRSQVTN